MSGYCSDCDKQIEFHDETVKAIHSKYGIEIYLVCPWCDKEELLITI